RRFEKITKEASGSDRQRDRCEDLRGKARTEDLGPDEPDRERGSDETGDRPLPRLAGADPRGELASTGQGTHKVPRDVGCPRWKQCHEHPGIEIEAEPRPHTRVGRDELAVSLHV